MVWYHRQGEAQRGPISWEELVMGVRTGTVAPHDLVWRQDMPDWQAAAAIPGLYGPPATAYAGTSLGNDPAMRWILPVGRSGWAIAAGYLGLFAILIRPAPLALIAGLMAVSDIRKHSEKLGMGRAIFGIVAGAIGSALLVAIIASSS